MCGRAPPELKALQRSEANTGSLGEGGLFDIPVQAQPAQAIAKLRLQAGYRLVSRWDLGDRSICFHKVQNPAC